MEDKRLHAARVAALFAVARPAYAGGAAIAAVLVAMLWGSYPAGRLLGWLFVLFGVMLARAALHRAYARKPEPGDPEQWERRYVLGTFAAGLLWAYAAATLTPPSNQLLEAAVVIVIGGVLVAGTGLSAASLRAVYAFVSPALVALTAHLALQPDGTHRMLAGAIVLFSVVMARMAHEINRTLVEALRERLRNEELLSRAEASETRLRDAMESFPEGIAVWDGEDRLTVCNDSYARLYGAGRAAAELVGTPFERIAASAWEAEHPPGQGQDAGRAAWIERHIAEHRAGKGESHQYQGRDGRWRQASTVRMRGGGWVALVADITELKRAQDAFFKVLAEEDLVLDTLPVGVAFIEDATVVRCNRRLEQILGYAPGELRGQSTQVWFTSEERWSAARSEVYRRMDEGGIMEGDARLVRKDGSRVWCRALGRSLDSESSRRASIITFTDIDERIAAERALKESEEKLRLAVEAAELQYWEWDRESGNVTWGGPDPRAADVHVRPWTELRDKVHPEDRERYLAAVETAWEKGESYAAEYRVQERGGAVRWFLARGVAVGGAAGAATRMIGVTQDITARKAGEDMVRFLAHHDPLTGLPNRRLLDDRLRQAIFHAERRGAKVAAMLVDLDEFKRVNDTAGHRAGDAVLREVASRLGSCVRKADTLARQGGDEFVIVVADVQTEADCHIVAEKILRALEPQFTVEGNAYRIGASIGISIAPGDAGDAETLLRNADAAMYRAKQLGRNRYRFHGQADVG